MTTKVRRSVRTTIKIHRAAYEQLRDMRKATGCSISQLISMAVMAYANPRPGVKRTRVRKLRGSR